MMLSIETPEKVFSVRDTCKLLNVIEAKRPWSHKYVVYPHIVKLSNHRRGVIANHTNYKQTADAPLTAAKPQGLP